MNSDILDTFREVLEKSKPNMSPEEYEIKLNHLNSWKEWVDYINMNRKLFYNHMICMVLLFPYWIYREIKAEKLSNIMMKNLNKMMEYNKK